MESLKHHLIARPLSCLMSLLIALLPIYLLLGTPKAAHAQQAVRQPLVGVLDFSNDTGYGGPDVGRTAADAFVNELSASGKYDVLSRAEVQEGLDNLNLAPPLDAIDLQRLAKQLQADSIVTGEVLAISRFNGGKQVQAVVVVRMTDSTTGQLINGSLARGTSTPRDGAIADDDALVDEAIGKAMFAAVRQINNFNLPIATVMSNENTNTVLLNKGSRDGLQSGLNMIVTRGDQTVGTIKVTSVEPDESYGLIVDQGNGIRPQDVAKGIFTLPEYTVKGNTVVTDSDISNGAAIQSTKRSSFAGIGGVILAILAAALLVSLVNRGSSTGALGGGAVDGVYAQAEEGQGAGLPYSLSYVSAPVPNYASYAVKVHLSNGNLNLSQLVQYHLYRDGSQPYYPGVASTTTNGTTAGTTTTGITLTTGTTTTAGTTTAGTTTAGTTTAGTTTAGTTTAGTTTTGTTTTTGISTLGATGPCSVAQAGAHFIIDSGSGQAFNLEFVIPAAGSTGNASTGNTNTTTTGGGTNTTGQVGGGLNLGSLGTANIYSAGPAVGVPHSYAVTAVYAVSVRGTGTTGNNTTNGNNTTGNNVTTGYEETATSNGQASGTATPIIPPDPTQASEGVKVNGIASPMTVGITQSTQFSSISVPGGDTNILELSTSPSFANKKVSDKMFATESGNQTIVYTFGGKAGVTLSSLFPSLSAGQPVYYRLAVKNSQDSPGPIIPNSSFAPNATTFGNGSSYIYSVEASFQAT